MIHCSNCNCELPDNAKFCPECGTPYTPEVRLSTDSPEAVAVPERMLCDKCGLELPAGARFCTVCGGKAVSDKTVISPTAGHIGGAAASAVTSSDNSMKSLSLDNSEPLFSTSVGEEDFVPEIETIPEIGSIPEVGAMPETPAPVSNPVVEEAPLLGLATAVQTPTVSPVIPSVEPVNSVIPEPVATTPAQPVNITAKPVSEPVNSVIPQSVSTPAQPTNSVLGPVSASQPVSDISQPVTPTAPVSSGAAGAFNSVAATDYAAFVAASNAANATNANNTTTTKSKSAKKKMGIGAKIGIIAGSVVGAVAIAGGVLFATNKAFLLSTLLGKEKYAVMVESDAIMQAASGIKSEDISRSVELLTNAYASLAAVGFDDDAMGSFEDVADSIPLYNGHTDNKAVPMMNTAGTTGLQGFDLAGYITMLNEQYTKLYGGNALKETITANVKFGNSIKELAGDVPVEDIEALINNSELSMDIVAGESALQAKLDAKVDTANVDVYVAINADGGMYLALPFVSDKAIFVELDLPEANTEKVEYLPISLEKAEIERIITAVVECYLRNYKESAIEMENGSVEVAGESIEGKAITAEFAGDALEKLFTDCIEIVVNDEYLKGEIVSYAKQFNEEFTEATYDESVADLLEMEATDDDKLIITTIIDKNGNILAKSFKAVDEKGEAVASYYDTETKSAYELSADNGTGFTCVLDKTSDTDGKAAVVVTNVDVDENGKETTETMNFNVEYSGVGTTEFGGRPVATGTYTFTMGMPESLEDQLGEEAFAAVNGMSLTVSQNVSGGNTSNSMIKVSVPNYGDFEVNYAIEVSDREVDAYPANVIDLTDAINNEMVDDATTDALKDYLDEVGEAYNGLMPFFEKYENLFGKMPEYTNPLDQPEVPGVSVLSLEDLKQSIVADVTNMTTLAQSLTEENADIMTRLTDLYTKYSALAEKVGKIDEKAENAQELIQAANDEYWALYNELVDIQLELEVGGSNVPKLPQVNPDEIDKMEYASLYVLMSSYNAEFEKIKKNESDIVSEEELKVLFDTADYAYYDVEHDYDYFQDALDRGNLNVNLLNSWRRSMKEYIPAVNALIEELTERGYYG